MFDSVTASLLRSAPPLPGLSSEILPSLFTQHYADLVSQRLRGDTSKFENQFTRNWTLEKIADAYELLASTVVEPEQRRASAFVAATAHQILSRRDRGTDSEELNLDASYGITREAVPSDIASALLFLIAEQYADANEASQAIQLPNNGSYESRILTENIRDLTSGRLISILERATRWRVRGDNSLSLQEKALTTILRTMITGVEVLAANALGKNYESAHLAPFANPQELFENIITLSQFSNSNYTIIEGKTFLSLYSGPHHLAILLLAVAQTIEKASLAKVPPPNDLESPFWTKWISHRAEQYPFLWPNHQEAIAKRFYDSGTSAVLILPTGAGKTTVSSLKIAGVLASGKRVIFLAPTHALVDQMTDDLQGMFPQDLYETSVGSDFDLSFFMDFGLSAQIEVMTPERCLALISFAPEVFSDVGLLVFDECHLLSPEQHNIRRALDGMLCLLAFNSLVPDADMLFLSAMLKNGEQFAGWISSLTGRNTVHIDLLWKPSRQARGVIVYEKKELQDALAQASEAHRKSKAQRSLSAKAKKLIQARPRAIWGLQHNWRGDKKVACSYTNILDTPISLGGAISRRGIYATPNANHVAAQIAISAAKNGLKTIIFVNTKLHSVSSAREISGAIGKEIPPTQYEQKRWAVLEAELGGLGHSMLEQGMCAVSHNSAMLRQEREISERMFKRGDGADVIVATPTLAQGLNLPAHIAILAGDKRMNASTNQREALNAHELLNAAARAGRAGHLANGIVLLIPEPLMDFETTGSVSGELIKKLESILPDSDRCLTIRDPLEFVLDKVSSGEVDDIIVKYAVNRLAELNNEENSRFNINKSFSGYLAHKSNTQQIFEEKINNLTNVVKNVLPITLEKDLLLLASQSGLSASILSRLKKKVEENIGQLPETIPDWVCWFFDWLKQDDEARKSMFFDISSKIMGVAGLNRNLPVDSESLTKILPGVQGWLYGKPLCEIEVSLRQQSGKSGELGMCLDARELVNNIIPRGLTFTLGILTQVVKKVDPFERQPSLDLKVVEALSSAVRLGYDTPEKLSFSTAFKTELGRVQIHNKWNSLT
ncbi:DEAD/DEAH box helicase [Desulfovibrio sp. OttesenSCG-928-C14]|nr:DEAD/DEAH box helicase [Desulfovibrio sp. OttesenSCG-928-C14]